MTQKYEYFIVNINVLNNLSYVSFVTIFLSFIPSIAVPLNLSYVKIVFQKSPYGRLQQYKMYSYCLIGYLSEHSTFDVSFWL